METHRHSQEWEHCEIVYEITNKGYPFSIFGVKSRFWVQGFTSQGTYTVAISDGELPGTPHNHSMYEYHRYFEAVEALERKLLIDGWEPLSRTGYWYSRKYRRRVRP